MCAIAGAVGVASLTLRDVENMIHTIRYRGSDEMGAKNLGKAIIGHARLAVVDKENGMQPMSNSDDTVWVTFNGEIYNYVELRNELKAKGYQFKSRCDTEVLVHLWREEGEKMLDRLIGMFAFFIWDTKNQCGILARDRQGIKPCFISEYKGGLVFCSEIKGILALPQFQREVNLPGLKEVFTYNYCIPPHTCFKNIYSLEPGNYLYFKGDKPPVKKRYWQWPFYEERQTPDFADFSALLNDAVRMQMRFDVAGGLYLSGGVDSSVIASHLTQQWNTPQLEAIGLDFEDSRFSEYEYSVKVSSLFDINLQKALINHDLIPQIANDVVYHAEQPHGDFSFFLFYDLARKAHSTGKIVMFSGDGPDETMAGFRHNEQFFNEQTRMNFSLRDYFDVISYMKKSERERLLNADFELGTPDPFHRFEEIIDPWRDLEPIEQIMAYECTALMPGNNLVKGDRMGCSWSIEGRSPFLDHRVLEQLTRLPVNQKFRNGYGKYYLKSYAATKYPTDLIFKKKSMPTAPIGEWIKAPLYDWARNILATENDLPIIKKAALQLLDEHKRGTADYTRNLRTLIMVQLWYKRFFTERSMQS